MLLSTVDGNKDCTGCKLCEYVCPRNAVYFEKDKEGFDYPKVNTKTCFNCKLCVSKCPQTKKELRKTPITAYATVHSDYKILKLSASGGAFAALAEEILSEGGIVFGTDLDTSDWKAKVVPISTDFEIQRLQGSKYVQSDMHGVYRELEQHLKNGIKVLFTGTPCQVAGVCSAFGHYPNLITVDLVCHGVPSPNTFIQYIDFLEKKIGKKITSYRFRSKKFGWKVACEFIDEDGKVHILLGNCDLYGALYYGHFFFMRESCYKCSYACPERIGDLTICDYWGIEKYHPNINCGMGASAVLCNSQKGIEFWEKASIRGKSLVTNPEWVIEGNGNLQHPTRRPIQRDYIGEQINSMGFEAAVMSNCKVYPVIYSTVLNALPKKIVFFLGDVKRKTRLYINKVKKSK